MRNDGRLIYMDHSATTPVRAEVVEAMLPWFGAEYGNPSSMHRLGRNAHAAIEMARRTLIRYLGGEEGEIVFTAGGSDGANLALRGIALARREATGANRIVVSAIEHKAVLATAESLRNHFGFALTVLPVDSVGMVDLDDVLQVVEQGDVAVVSVQVANNEVGTIQSIEEIASVARAFGVPMHTDAVQAAGRTRIDIPRLHVDALTIAAHKFYGPKGVGALWLRKGTPYLSTLTGGSHEGGRRAGTENVPLIVGMAAAFALSQQEQGEEKARLIPLRDRLIHGVLERIPGVRVTGPMPRYIPPDAMIIAPPWRLPHHASFVFEGVEAEPILIALDMAGIAASSGSACTSASQAPSHVLLALGISAQDAAGGLRLSLGHSTTLGAVDYVLDVLPPIVQHMRN